MLEKCIASIQPQTRYALLFVEGIQYQIDRYLLISEFSIMFKEYSNGEPERDK